MADRADPGLGAAFESSSLFPYIDHESAVYGGLPAVRHLYGRGGILHLLSDAGDGYGIWIFPVLAVPAGESCIVACAGRGILCPSADQRPDDDLYGEGYDLYGGPAAVCLDDGGV